MRILVIGTYAPSLTNFRGPLLRSITDLGHNVVTCANGDGDEITIKQLDLMGIEYHGLAVDRGGINPLSDLRYLFQLLKLMRDVKPDIILAYTIKPVIYGLLASRVLSIPRRYAMIEGLGYAFTEQGQKTNLRRKTATVFARVLYRLALPYAIRVFVLNPDDEDWLQDTNLVKSEQCSLLNGIGVDLDHYTQVSPPTGPTSFLLIARLLKDKGVVEYAEAAKILKDKYPDIVFRLVGRLDEGKPDSVDVQQLEQWQRDGYLEYAGSTNDVRPFLRDTSVYVLPSYYREGTPRTILEAMATGRAIITTDAPGCRETVVEGENGFLIPVRDVPALTVAMERLIQQPRLVERMGQRSREIAVEKYDVHKVNAVIMAEMGLLTLTDEATETA